MIATILGLFAVTSAGCAMTAAQKKALVTYETNNKEIHDVWLKLKPKLEADATEYYEQPVKLVNPTVVFSKDGRVVVLSSPMLLVKKNVAPETVYIIFVKFKPVDIEHYLWLTLNLFVAPTLK